MDAEQPQQLNMSKKKGGAAEEATCTSRFSEGSRAELTAPSRVGPVELNDIVLAKVKGHPQWPARVSSSTQLASRTPADALACPSS